MEQEAIQQAAQGFIGKYDTAVSAIAVHATEKQFLKKGNFLTNNTSDYALLPLFKQALVQPYNGSKLIVLHIMGSHENFCDRIKKDIYGLKDKDLSDISKWWSQIEEWRKVDSLAYKKSPGVIKPQSVIEALYEVTEGKAIVTSDVGQHQMWAAQYYLFDEPRQWINSGGLGTMGFGLPAAMGAKLAMPEKDIACVTGEGSIQMMLQELSTMLQYATPVKIINLNNGYLGMVRQWQEFFYEKRYAMSYMDALPDFIKLAESYGHLGIKVDKEEDLKPALIEAFKQKDRTVFLDIITDPSENVFPMIPAGGAHCDMLLAGRDEMVSKDETDFNAV